MKLADKIELELEEDEMSNDLYTPKSKTTSQPLEVLNGPQRVAGVKSREVEETIASALELHASISLSAFGTRYPDDVKPLAVHLNAIRTIARDQYDDPIAKATSSSDYTDEGIARMRREAAEKVLAGLDPYQKLASENEAGVAKFDEDFLAAGTLEAPESSALIDEVRKLDPLTRQKLYAQAIEENDNATIAAFEAVGKIFDPTTKRLEDFLDPELVRSQRIARGRALKPEQAEKSSRLRELAGIYRGAVSAVRGAITRRHPDLDNREPAKA